MLLRFSHTGDEATHSTCSSYPVYWLTAKVLPPPHPLTPPPYSSSFLLLLQVEKFGKPTWRRLVEAVKDHVGGNNCALAQTIARDHPDAPGNDHIYMVMYTAIQLASSYYI